MQSATLPSTEWRCMIFIAATMTLLHAASAWRCSEFHCTCASNRDHLASSTTMCTLGRTTPFACTTRPPTDITVQAKRISDKTHCLYFASLSTKSVRNFQPNQSRCMAGLAYTAPPIFPTGATVRILYLFPNSFVT